MNVFSIATVYVPAVTGLEAPQFCSSDMSPQSLSPSQTHRADMQRPELAHWSWPSRHATYADTVDNNFSIPYVKYRTLVVRFGLVMPEFTTSECLQQASVILLGLVSA